MPVRIIASTPSGYAYPLLIKNLLKPALTYAPDGEIVYRDRRRYTYRMLADRVAQLANALGDIGVGPGDTVAVMDWDSHRYLECYFAVPMIGAILHTLNIRLSPDQVLYTINHAEDDVIIVHGDFLPLLNQIQDRFETDKKIVVIGEGGEPRKPLSGVVGQYEALLSGRPPEYLFPDFDENAAATLFYTTGTTGPPKGVSFSHRQIVLHTHGFMGALCAYRSYAAVDSGDVYMPLTPMFHVHAWGMPYLFTLLGAKQVYPGRYEPGALLRLIAREGVTFSHCVPTVLHMLLNDPGVDAVDLSGLKMVIGGSALSRGLCEAASARGVNLFSAYGMSETCPLLTVANARPHMLDWDAASQIEVRRRAGLPAPHVDLEIVDPNGAPLPRDGRRTGEVVARSPWLAQSYFKDPEMSEALWRDGWLHTGDVGYIDEEGYLHITDRLKDVIKSGGEWISSLALKPDFQGAAAVDDLKAFIADHVARGVIPRYGMPDRVVIVDDIAKTSVGKFDKKRLRAQYAPPLSDGGPSTFHHLAGGSS